MPNFFSLTRKSDPAAGPVSANTLDEEICAHLGVEIHPTNYHVYWYDSIGFRLALGMTWDEIRGRFREQEEDANAKGEFEYADLMGVLLRITDWLEERFTVDSGHCRK